MAYSWEEVNDSKNPKTWRLLSGDMVLAASIRPSHGGSGGYVWFVHDGHGRLLSTGPCGAGRHLEEAKAEAMEAVLDQGQHRESRLVCGNSPLQDLYDGAVALVEGLAKYPETEFPKPILPALTALQTAILRVAEQGYYGDDADDDEEDWEDDDE